MALITSLELSRSNGKIQPTQVKALVKIFETEGNQSIVQIDTFGSDERMIPGKQSQTIQLDKNAAFALNKILRDIYHF